jgi:hypothetical protein
MWRAAQSTVIPAKASRKRGSILRPVNNQWIPAYAGHCHGSIALGRPVEVRIASLNPRKQVVTLLDEPLAIIYGFWKTICTCGRSRFSVARSAWATSLPRSRSSPESRTLDHGLLSRKRRFAAARFSDDRKRFAFAHAE